jgi:hypothetical protein
MKPMLLAEFNDARMLEDAAREIRRRGFAIVDAFTPFPIKSLIDMIDTRPSRIRGAMLVAGLAVAAGAFALQWYSAVIDYPINSGGRPLNSWPVFLLVPFEVGVLAAAIGGFVAMLLSCGLPRLHHPVFEAIGFERATQDRFFLLVCDPDGVGPAPLRDAFRELGAVLVQELPR